MTRAKYKKELRNAKKKSLKLSNNRLKANYLKELRDYTLKKQNKRGINNTIEQYILKKRLKAILNEWSIRTKTNLSKLKQRTTSREIARKKYIIRYWNLWRHLFVYELRKDKSQQIANEFHRFHSLHHCILKWNQWSNICLHRKK